MADKDQEIIKIIRKSFPEVEAIYLFGSRASGKEHSGSDYDIALLLPPLTAKSIDKNKLIESQNQLAWELDCDVDLINLRDENTVFQHEIIFNSRVLFIENEYAFHEFEMLTMSYYQKLNEERAEILKEILKTGRILA